jgi:hypothetical protein
MVFSRVGPNQSIEWGQIRISKSADTNTVEISAFGGSVILQTPMRTGQRLVLSNLKTKATAECMVAYCGAKGTAGQVGLAFILANQSFWPIVFPPADWSSRDSEAKRSGS